jgi:hypothetical protein
MGLEVIFDILPGDWNKNEKTPNGAISRLALHGFTQYPGK